MEKVRVDLLPAASRSAMTVPNRGSSAVDAVVVGNLFPRRKRLRSVYDAGVVDFQQPFAFAERPLGKNTKSIDGRVLHPDAAEFYAHFWTFLHERLVLSLGAGASAVNPSRLIGHCLKAAAPQVTGSCSGP